MSDVMGSPRGETRVGESRKSEFVTDSVIRVPLASVSVLVVFRVPSRAIGVEVSHDDVIPTEVKKKVKVVCEIVGKTGYRGDVNIINVDGDIVEGDCNGEMLSDGLGGEK